MSTEESAAVTLVQAREVLAAQPFSTLVGAELTRFEPGVAELRIPLRAELRQQFGFAHGGVLAYAVDNALTFAGGTVLGASIVSQGFTIDFLRPACGVLLRAVASVSDHGERRALCRCEVYDVDEAGTERRAAAGQGVIGVIDLDRSPGPG